MKKRPIIVVTLLMLAAAASFTAAQPAPATAAAVAQEKLTQAAALFADGSYDQARELVSACIAEYEAGKTFYPGPTIARLYVLDALIAYAFRDEGYAERVDQVLRRGIAIDLDLEVGDPAEIPPFVQERFGKLMAEELARYSRSARPSAVGLFFALVLEPTVLSNPSLLQPGISYAFNLNDSFTLSAEVRFPLQLPLWNSIRGQVGFLWYPSFRVERFSTGISLSYMFGLDQLSTYTHSISFGGRIDFLTRGGFGMGGNAELVRADLVIGSGSVSEPPTYTPIPLLGLLRVAFANINLYAYYAF